MKNFKKIFVGKGKKVANLDIVKITCRLDALQAIAYHYEGIDYVTFEVAKMKETDPFGRSHTCFYDELVKENDQVAPAKEPIKAKKPKKTAPKTEKVVDPLPF